MIILDDPYIEVTEGQREATLRWFKEAIQSRLKDQQQETLMHPSNEPGAAAGATIEMPRYQCHKKVWALKIGSVRPVVGGAAILTPVDTRYAQFDVGRDYVDKHKPQAGGYYVVYDDGYKSFSPAEAFESGYTKIPYTPMDPEKFKMQSLEELRKAASEDQS